MAHTLKNDHFSQIERFSHVVLEVTNRCNLACRNCYVSSGKQYKHPPLAHILAMLKRLRELETEEVLICGGEPTSRKDLVKILEYSTNIALPVSLSTNGIINSRLAERISTLCTEVDVSIRGATKEQFESISMISGSYEAMRKGLRALTKFNVNLNINYDLTLSNYLDLYKAVKELVMDDVKIQKVWIQRTSLRGRSISEFLDDSSSSLDIENYHHVLQQMSGIENQYGIKCRFIDPLPLCLIPPTHWHQILDSKYGISWAAVSPEGVLRRDPVDPFSIVGNIFDEDIVQVWNNNSSLQFFRSLRWLPEICQSCAVKSRCKGGFCSSTLLAEDNLGIYGGYEPDILIFRNPGLITPQ